MNQNITYTYTADPRNNQQQQQNQQMREHIQGLSFHPSSYQGSTYTTSTSTPFHANNASFLQSNVLHAIPQSSVQPRQQQHQQQQSDGDEKPRIASMMEAYFVEPNTSTSNNWAHHSQGQVTYTNGTLIAGSPNIKNVTKINISPDKAEKERLKKARQAEAARMRYHRLTPEEKRELNLKRTLAQKRKRQREKELEELDNILRETNDIQEDPDITEQLREKRMRAKWAEAARARYARMTPEERRAHNNRRRMRQMQNALAAVKGSSEFAGLQMVPSGDPVKDEEAVRQHIKSQNAKKAEAARQRYHRMTEDEKRLYNQRRTEAFRRRRMEEEMLLAMPIGRINGEALDRAQQIVVRNAKRAEAARARYQRMTPDQRKVLGKSYNQKRYTPKRRSDRVVTPGGEPVTPAPATPTAPPKKTEDLDALSSLERDVLKRTQQAQQVLMRQGQRLAGVSAPSAGAANSSYIIQQNPSHLSSQLSGSGNNHQNVVHVAHQMQNTLSQTLLSQQQGHHAVVHHTPTSGHLNVNHQPSHQVSYTSNGSMMINGQHNVGQQQVINPYGAPQRN
ncbi:unnamed protein product [Auanema sp. JU1783]|nr:unnamed protein product [Auanema sp. JU1783]